MLPGSDPVRKDHAVQLLHSSFIILHSDCCPSGSDPRRWLCFGFFFSRNPMFTRKKWVRFEEKKHVSGHREGWRAAAPPHHRSHPSHQSHQSYFPPRQRCSVEAVPRSTRNSRCEIRNPFPVPAPPPASPAYVKEQQLQILLAAPTCPAIVSTTAEVHHRRAASRMRDGLTLVYRAYLVNSFMILCLLRLFCPAHFISPPPRL